MLGHYLKGWPLPEIAFIIEEKHVGPLSLMLRTRVRLPPPPPFFKPLFCMRYIQTEVFSMYRLLCLFLFYLLTGQAFALEVDSSEVILPSSIGYTSETWEQINFGTTFSSPPIVKILIILKKTIEKTLRNHFTILLIYTFQCQ